MMGAHEFTPIMRPPSSFYLQFFAVLSLLTLSSGLTESEALLKFKASLKNPQAIPWNPSTPPCGLGPNGSNWLGVICQDGKVWGLQLENMGLAGTIDMDALSQLPELRSISLTNNRFEGPLPDLRKLPKLRGIYFSRNHLSGEIPDDAFTGMDALRRVLLANNAFTGKIPSSLAKLPILVQLRLEGNQFQGSIPDFKEKELPSINLANNQLEGPIPPRLRHLDPKLFSGNKGLCGGPLQPCTGGDKGGTAPAAGGEQGNGGKSEDKSSSSSSSSSSTITKVALGVLLAAILLALILVILLMYQKKQRQATREKQEALIPDEHEATEVEEAYVPPTTTARASSTKKRPENGKLEFVRDDRKTFDLSDLLTASAEVLESGNFVSSYRVEIFAGQMLVVKRFRQMSKVGREDFHEHIRRMGKLRHPNVLGLVAYYYRREEKLLIFDYFDNGSLASRLHGNRTDKDPVGLDWPTRLKIIKGVASGLAYLYSQLPSLTVPHGYLKSSNVLLNDEYEPLLMDYALQPLINPEQAKKLMVAYKSPEYAQNGQINKKTDVWSLGILILEVLTGKFPTNFLAVGNVKGENLVSWVKEIASEEENGEDVFDKGMGRTQNGKGEMRKLLKIGFSCSHEDVDVRWSIKEAMEKIEEIKENDG